MLLRDFAMRSYNPGVVYFRSSGGISLYPGPLNAFDYFIFDYWCIKSSWIADKWFQPSFLWVIKMCFEVVSNDVVNFNCKCYVL